MISIHPANLSPAQAAAAAATHGMGLVQDVISCTLIQRLNGDRSLRLQAPYTEHNHGLLAADRLIFADGQFYRIARPGRSDRGGQKSISIEALHVIYDLQQSSIENIETKEDPNFVDGITAGEALGQVLSGSAFAPGTVDIDPAKRDYLEILRENRLDCLTQIIDTWGGEIVPDNWTIHLLNESGADRGVQLRLGRNMDGLDIDEDISAVKTRLHIVGYQDASIESVNDGKDYLDSPNIGLYSQVREDYAYFEDIDDPAELKRLGLERLSEVDKVQLTARVDLVRLRQCAPYHHYAELDRIALGDTVAVIHDKFGSISVRVLEREAEILRDGTVINTRLTLGNAQADQFFRGFRAAAEAALAARRQAAQAAQTANAAKALTAQQQALLNQANEQIAQAEQRIQDAEAQIADAGQALAGAQSTLTEHGLRIDQTETDIASKASQTSVDALNQTITQQGTLISQNATDIALKADQSEVDTLSQTVTDQGTAITQNASDIALRATKSEVNTLAGRVTTAEGTLTTHAGQIAAKASQSDVNALDGRVTTAEGELVTHAGQIAAKASQTDVNAIDGRLTTAEGTLVTQAGQIAAKASQTDLNTLTGRVSSAETSLTLKADQATLVSTRDNLQSQINAVPGQIDLAVSSQPGIYKNEVRLEELNAFVSANIYDDKRYYMYFSGFTGKTALILWKPNRQLMPGTYTLSFFARGNPHTDPQESQIRIAASATYDGSYTSITYAPITSNLYAKQSVTFTVSADACYVMLQLYNHKFGAIFNTAIHLREIQLEQGSAASFFAPSLYNPASGVITPGSYISILNDLIKIASGGKIELLAGSTFKLLAGSGATEMGIDNSRADGLGLWMGGSPTTAKNRQWMNGTAQFSEIRIGNNSVNQFGRAYTFSFDEIGSYQQGFMGYFSIPPTISGIQSVRMYVIPTIPRYYSPGVGVQLDASQWPPPAGELFILQVDGSWAGALENQAYTQRSDAKLFSARPTDPDPISSTGRDVTALVSKTNELINRDQHLFYLEPVSGSMRFIVTIVVFGTGVDPASTPY